MADTEQGAKLRELIAQGLQFSEAMQIFGEGRDETELRYVEAAREKWTDEGECEIDDCAQVSLSTDGGAYVHAWVWVSDEFAGIATEGTDGDEG